MNEEHGVGLRDTIYYRWWLLQQLRYLMSESYGPYLPVEDECDELVIVEGATCESEQRTN